ncbi:FLR-4 protein, partial [Aphelenchoides avenae]
FFGASQDVEPNHRQLLTLLRQKLTPDDPLFVPDFDSTFKFVSDLGKGRFGKVAKYEKTEAGKYVACKLVDMSLFNAFQDMDSIKKRLDIFLEELSVLHKASQESDKIVDFIGLAADAEKMVVLTEYADNGSVRDLLESKGPLPETTALKYTMQTLDALQYLHNKKPAVVHRDIKASNLLLSATGMVKLGNFGLVRDLVIGGLHWCRASTYITYDVRKHVLYTAPEQIPLVTGDSQAKPSVEAEKAADIWALGCTFVEMLLGDPPYADYCSAVVRVEHDDEENEREIAGFNQLIKRSQRPTAKRKTSRWQRSDTRHSSNLSTVSVPLRKTSRQDSSDLEPPPPYNSASLFPSASTVCRCLLDKMLEKDPAVRPSVDVLLVFLNSVQERWTLEEMDAHYAKIYQTVKGSRSSDGSLQSRLAKWMRLSSSNVPNGFGGQQSFNDDRSYSDHSKRSRRTTSSSSSRYKELRNLLAFLKYGCFRSYYFSYCFLVHFAYVTSFLLLGILMLSILFLIAFGVIALGRWAVSEMCECDVSAPQHLIISGIFLILLFALLFT